MNLINWLFSKNYFLRSLLHVGRYTYSTSKVNILKRIIYIFVQCLLNYANICYIGNCLNQFL